jgi:hypothetical protein
MPAHDITTSYYLEAAVMTAPGGGAAKATPTRPRSGSAL